MAYKDKKKKCAYCNKEFDYQRVSARYCSKSCAAMDNRRKKNPKIYRHYNPIHLEYENEPYKMLQIKAMEQDIRGPKKYLEWLAEEMITKNMHPLFFTEEEENVLKFVLKSYYPNQEFQPALLEWIKSRSEEEAIDLRKGKIKKNT